MKVAVLGLWHLGCVTAACVAAAGHDVVAFDPDPAERSRRFAGGGRRSASPGSHELIATGWRQRQLAFHDRARRCRARRRRRLGHVRHAGGRRRSRGRRITSMRQVEAAFPVSRRRRARRSVSSQLPVGTIAALEDAWARGCRRANVSFRRVRRRTCGWARPSRSFTQPDRVVVGVRDDRARDRVTEPCSTPITDRIEWMSVESAEMTKHAINAFLATSVTFINEFATLCEEPAPTPRKSSAG